MSEERTRLQNQQISSNTSVSLMKKTKKQLELRFLNGYTNISRRRRRRQSTIENQSHHSLFYLARGKYIVDSIKTEPERRIYQQVFNSPRLNRRKR